MNALREDVGGNPLASQYDCRAALADLVFAYSSTDGSDSTRPRPLALLPNAALELDLTDPEQREFGDYELLELIGEGGMGVVYRAYQKTLDREVAVKLLAAGPWASKPYVERFRREAQNAARMQHPNIVAIYEVASAEELHFFSMRLVRGPSLAVVLKRDGPLPPRKAASLMRTIAEAVDYAHRLGVLHLDLKPGNVLIDETGTAHVADFGLARRLDPADGAGIEADTDEISGTPSYMAPEQANMRKLSPAADVWGLGAILYELLTGRPPFLGDTPKDTLQLVREATLAPPRELAPAIPRDLQAIALKCLTRDARQRYAGARDLVDDLSRFLEGRAVRARPLNLAQRTLRWARREPYVAAFAALFAVSLLVGLIGIAWQWRQARANAALAQSNADLAQNTLWASRTADAQRLIAEGDAYKALVGTVTNLREMEAKGAHEQAALQRLRIGTVLANAPQLIDTIGLDLGSKPNEIANLALAPDGKSFAVSTVNETATERSVYLVDVASGSVRWSTGTNVQSHGMLGSQDYLELRFSADGHRLIGSPFGDFGAAAPLLRPRYIDNVLIDVDAGRRVEPPPGFADFLANDFAPDGRYALLFDKHGYVQRWRTLPWAAAGQRVKLEGNINPDDRFSALQGEALLAEGGDLAVFTSDSNLTFRVFDAESLRVRHALKLTPAQGRATAWMLARDGRRLAIGTTSGQVAIWNLDTGDAAWFQPQLTARISVVRFSNDDSRLLAISSEPSELRVFDARSGELVGTPVALGHDLTPGGPNNGEFGPDAATLLTTRWTTHATLWRLPEQGFPLQAPATIAPLMVAQAARFAIATDASSRLLVTDDNNLIKLWRVQWSPLMDRRAAPLVADTLRFDGRHLVAVDADRVRVFDAASGRFEGMPIALPQAPTYAGLEAGGERVVTITGRQLACHDRRNGQPCWPALTLPDSPSRIGTAARASVLAVATGANESGAFLEHIKLIDLVTGQQRGADIALPGPLAALRLSDDGRHLLTWHDSLLNAQPKARNLLYVIDASTNTQQPPLVHEDAQSIIDARFAADDSMWSLAGPDVEGNGADHTFIRHWSAQGDVLAKVSADGSELSLLPVPADRGVIDTTGPRWISAGGAVRKLNGPYCDDRVNASALSADGKLLALATFGSVVLLDLASNETLVPNFKLPLPNHDAVQQLAFAPDSKLLVGRTISGHWFRWHLKTDTRALADIEQDVQLRDLTNRGMRDSVNSGVLSQAEPLPPLPDEQRRLLRNADPGPAPADDTATAAVATAVAPIPADARYRTLDLDAIANVEPREPMNRVTRVPPLPQSLPTLPRGLQRYDGVDFLLGRAVQLSGTPNNLLDVEFPARSARLDIGTQRIDAVDALVLQFKSVHGEVGNIVLHYADGGEARLAIVNGRDTVRNWEDKGDATTLRIGWLAAFSTQMRYYGMAASGEETMARSYVARLANPQPARAVKSISLLAPPEASPGLLFLALTLEPEPAGQHP
ncbi:WD40 repeat domain-containing serine/threonine protein kinase [Rudaea sp.]|uniref:WD40 repeat domain-containing serine/threonine protein kinase n=1 Tax=Rudaea sp. TaxID=2136325 RepID=UPI002ED4CF3E